MFSNTIWGTAVLFGALALSPGIVVAANSSDVDELQNTVMDMLQRETKIALIEQLDRERKATGHQTAGTLSSTVRQEPRMEPPANEPLPSKAPELEKPKASSPKVLGIYGLRETLTADVRVDGQTLRFQRGSRFPKGYNSTSPYTLISIQTPCVTFADKEVTRTACVDDLPSQ